MKLSEVARCIKYLEILHLRMLLPDFESSATMSPPIEVYIINEFPFGSAFCYVFRGKWTNKKIDGCKTCFCPKKPYLHPEWKRVRKPRNEHLKMVEPPHINCRATCDGKLRPIQELIKEVQELSIEEIMKYLKKITFTSDQVRTLSCMWHFFVWNKIINGHIDKVDLRDFKKDYKF